MMLKTIIAAAGVACALIAAPAFAHDDDETGHGGKLSKEQDSALEHEIHAEEEFDTKHIFGFTEGADIGNLGDLEAEFETQARFGKLGGKFYNGVEQLASIEGVPVARLGYEISLHGVSQQMSGVPGLGTLSQTAFSGLSATPKFVVLDREHAPIGLSVSVGPEFDRLDPVVGAHSRNFLVPVNVIVDAELIEKKLYAGGNLLFSPEWDNEKGFGFSQYSLFGVTGAMTYRLTPKIAFGGQMEYYNVYNSLGFSNWAGWGSYIGPLVHMKLAHNLFFMASWSTQFAGKPLNASASALANYNASDLSRERAKLVIGMEF